MDSSNTIWYKKYKFQLCLISIGLFVFLNSLFGDFVWDDVSQIQNNYFVHSLSNIGSFFLGSTFTPQSSTNLQGLYYRPLMTTSFSFIYTLFGQQTFFYHFFQLVIHIANSLLLFILFKKNLKEQIAFIISLVFLVHPINVESVAYISTLGEPLFFFFGTTALILFQKEKLTVKRSILVSFLLFCSLLSKETGVLFGIIVSLYYLFFKKKSIPETIKTIAVAFTPLCLYLFLRFSVAKVALEKIPDVPMMTAPFAMRIFSMPEIFFFYIKTFFFPKDLFIYQEWIVFQADSKFYLPLLLDAIFLTLLCALGIWIWKTNKKTFTLFAFFTSWFLLGVGFHLQLIPLDMTVADHMFYFPMVGLLGVISLAIQNIKQPSHNLRTIGLTFAIAIICIFSLRTIIRNTNWYNGIALYGNDLRYQQNDRIENLLASALVSAGQLAQAQEHFEALLSRNPKEPALIVNLAIVNESQGNFQKAEELYQKGLQSDDSGVIYTNYARILYKQGKLQQAKDASSQGLKKFPNNSTLWIIDAIALYKLGNKQQALEAVQKAKDTSSDPRIDQIYQGISNDNLNY